MARGLRAVLGAVLVLGALGGTLRGEEEAEPKGEVTDQFIQQRKAALDKALEARIAKIETEHQETQAFHAKMKDDRVAFERKMVEERKAFLDTLKGMKPEERRQALREFNRKQEEARRAFRDEMQSRRREFQGRMEQGRREAKEHLREERRREKDRLREERQKLREERRQEKESLPSGN